VLVGFDFAFGYPAEAGLPAGRALCARLASLVRDEAHGANNRFEVAGLLNREARPEPRRPRNAKCKSVESDPGAHAAGVGAPVTVLDRDAFIGVTGHDPDRRPGFFPFIPQQDDIFILDSQALRGTGA